MCARYPGLHSPGRRQRGQALVYGLFVLAGGLAALFFLFNTGQLSQEKTRLVTTADAVAYSAGVMHARTLNFQAYANRAMVANTVAIAQLVSLASWVQYADNLATYGYAAGNPKFMPFYPSYVAARTSGPVLQMSLNDSGALERLARASDQLIRGSLQSAQLAAHNLLVPMRLQIMQAVADANFPVQDEVSVEPLATGTDSYLDFVTRYDNDQRTRFAEVAKHSSALDRFVPKRSWSLTALWNNCSSALPRRDWLDRRGGTELLGLEEWSAMDTLSEKTWVPANMFDALCRGVSESPAGWGMQAASNQPSDPWSDGAWERYDYAPAVNPGSSGMAIAMSSSAWDYSGLPGFNDLSAQARGVSDPRLTFSVRVRRPIGKTRSSEGNSPIASSPRLNAYRAKAAGDELVAVSTSEVFFEREGAAGPNVYGSTLGKPHEIGSLFNPYWQVHLVHSPAAVARAQALQRGMPP